MSVKKIKLQRWGKWNRLADAHLTIILCRSGVEEWFDIPSDLYNLTLCLSSTPVDGSIKVFPTPTGTSIALDAKGKDRTGVDLFYGARRALKTFAQRNKVSAVYVWIEYSIEYSTADLERNW